MSCFKTTLALSGSLPLALVTYSWITCISAILLDVKWAAISRSSSPRMPFGLSSLPRDCCYFSYLARASWTILMLPRSSMTSVYSSKVLLAVFLRFSSELMSELMMWDK